MATRTTRTPAKTPAAKSSNAPAQKAAQTGAAEAQAAAPAPSRATPATAAADGTARIVKLKDLVETVAAASGTKKPDARKAVEATLSAIAAALSAGSSLSLPPLGKLRVVKVADGAMTLKLRSVPGRKPAGKTLAEDGEDD
jgi:hypothetical protein